MEWKAKRGTLDRLVDWAAPAVLAGALLWAGLTLHQPLPATGLALVALVAGSALLRRIGPAKPAFRFQPAGIEADPDELLLDDPLVDVAPDSRVVRLFAQEQPTPGEMVARIEDYLSEPRRAISDAPAPDARDALHSALANIRASLR